MSTDRDKAARWKEAELFVERFQDLHCRPDGITLKAGTKENLKIMVHDAVSTARTEGHAAGRVEVWGEAISALHQQEPPEYDYDLMESGWEDGKQQAIEALEKAKEKS